MNHPCSAWSLADEGLGIWPLPFPSHSHSLTLLAPVSWVPCRGRKCWQHLVLQGLSQCLLWTPQACF